MATQLDVDVTERTDERIVRPRGEITASSIEEFRDRLADQLGVPRLVLDLRDVTFMDSTGLGLLAKAKRVADQSGGTLVVKNATSNVRRSLVYAGLEWLLVDGPEAPVRRDPA